MRNTATSGITPPSWREALPRIILRLAAVGLIVWIAVLFYGWAYGRIAMLDVDSQRGAMWGLLITTAILYALLMALPFIPGIEIAIALLVMNGASVAPLVYVATVLGLMLAFAAGRWISLDWLHAAFRDLHLIRACALLTRIKTQSPAERLAGLQQTLPNWARRALVDWRYLSLGALLNLPGNAAIGGGGGIMMMAGLSRLFHPGWVFVTLVLATAPVPVTVWLVGTQVLVR